MEGMCRVRADWNLKNVPAPADRDIRYLQRSGRSEQRAKRAERKS
jgi:hypothetical protein